MIKINNIWCLQQPSSMLPIIDMKGSNTEENGLIRQCLITQATEIIDEASDFDGMVLPILDSEEEMKISGPGISISFSVAFKNNEQLYKFVQNFVEKRR